MDKALKQAIKDFRELPDEELVCSNCGKSRPYFPVKSFGAALKAHALNMCWLNPDVCQETPENQRVFLDNKPLPSPSEIITHSVVRAKDKDGVTKKALLGSDGSLVFLKNQ